MHQAWVRPLRLGAGTMGLTESPAPLRYVDRGKALRVFETRSAYVSKLCARIADGVQSQTQIRYNTLATYSRALGLLSYALGHPTENICAFLRESVEASLRVVELRGTADSFPVIKVESEFPSHQLVRAETNKHKKEKDFSLGNAKFSAESLCYAIALRQGTEASKIAELIWDPPGAPYVGDGRYSVYTLKDQRIAYAIKAEFQNRHSTALSEIEEMRALSPPNKKADLEGNLIEAMARHQASRFLESLSLLLGFHKKLATRKSNRDDSDYFICIVALGLAVVAERRGLVAESELPAEDPFFPWRLFSSALEPLE